MSNSNISATSEMHESSQLDTDPYESGFEENSDTKDALPREVPSALKRGEENSLIPVLLPLPQCHPLNSGELSLIPDILMGWRPKLDKGGPIPLNFDLQQLPPSRNAAKGVDNPCVFHGFRPRDTFVLHKTMRGKSAYVYPFTNSAMQEALEFISMKDQLSKDPRPFVGMRKPIRHGDLVFDSTFESGNLDQAHQVSDSEYDLYMRTDANTRGHNQWFYFTVTAPRRLVRFHILNFTKRESLYEQGMMILVSEEENPGWHRGGSSVKYGYSKLNQWMTGRRPFYSLSFDYEFSGNGVVSFAYSIPYTYSRLLSFLDELNSGYTRKTLCKSLSGLDVPLITVTDPRSSFTKEHVFASARVHPGETHGSWMMEGFLRFITGDTSAAVALRKRVEFHVVPMLNPDGVVLGNYRSCLSGSDLNRQFQYPNPKLHPTVAHLKSLIGETAHNHKILAFIDMHAHSKKKSVFMYGPHFPLHSEKYYTMRVIPKLMSERTDMFRYYSCKFRNDKGKEKAARIVVAKEFGLANSYTLEASFHGYLNSERGTDPFQTDNLMTIGRTLGEVLYEFLCLRDEEESQRASRRLERLKRKVRKRSDGDIDFSLYPEAEVPKRSMADVIQTIKDEEMVEESDSGGSDSSASDDDLDCETQKEINMKIVEAVENLGTEAAGKDMRRVQVRKPQRDDTPNRPRTASTLAQFFSKAKTEPPKRRKIDSEPPKSEPKVLRPEFQESPIRPKSQSVNAPQTWRSREKRIINHRASLNLSQVPQHKSPEDSAFDGSRLPHVLKPPPTERRHSFSFDLDRKELPIPSRCAPSRQRDPSTRRSKQTNEVSQKHWASFLKVQPAQTGNRSITLSKKSRSIMYHLEKSVNRAAGGGSGAEEMLRRYAMLPRTKIKQGSSS